MPQAANNVNSVQQMLNLAGGSGIDSSTFAQRRPTLRAIVLDLPPLAPFTQDIIAQHGMQERVIPDPGNYFHADVADGNDRVLLANALQTEGVNTCRIRPGKVFKVLATGGQ